MIYARQVIDGRDGTLIKSHDADESYDTCLAVYETASGHRIAWAPPVMRVFDPKDERFSVQVKGPMEEHAVGIRSLEVGGRVCMVVATYGGAFSMYDVGPAPSRSVMRPAHKLG
jgi:hypothetical protein